MKEIKAVIQEFMLPRVVEALRAHPEFPGLTISRVRGFGRYGTEEDLEETPPKIKLEIVVPSALVENVVELIRSHAHQVTARYLSKQSTRSSESALAKGTMTRSKGLWAYHDAGGVHRCGIAQGRDCGHRGCHASRDCRLYRPSAAQKGLVRAGPARASLSG